MKLVHILTCIFLFLSFQSQAQSFVDDVIRRGVKLHDRGDYKTAIEEYKKALDINPSSVQAMYEISLSYLLQEDYENALKYSTKVVNSNYKPLLVDAYIVKSSALAALSKYPDAIALLNEALKKCGNDYLLFYNLALSYSKNQDPANAIVYLEKTIEERVNYSEAYYLYGYTLADQNRWMEAMLAFDSFLLLEPDDDRSKDVFADMVDILQNKLTDSDTKSSGVKGLDLLRIKNILTKVKKTIPEGVKDYDYLCFQEATKSILSELKLMQKEDNDGMFWNNFVPTFTDILDSGYFDVFCHYISAAAYPESLVWWKANQKKVEEFVDWFETTNGTPEGADEPADFQ